ncbi:MAG: hypothetical protein GF419_00650 [Ignavibacteriales bacterium]|nr:hypothetical protein [Ignavibacteriales bacterium]
MIRIPGRRFAQCNNADCRALFALEEGERPSAYGYLCPECLARTRTHHVVQCSSCATIVNFVAALENEEKTTFVVGKCSNCVGGVEDERDVAPLYTGESYA